jgi:hypothetical protein
VIELNGGRQMLDKVLRLSIGRILLIVMTLFIACFLMIKKNAQKDQLQGLFLETEKKMNL